MRSTLSKAGLFALASLVLPSHATDHAPPCTGTFLDQCPKYPSRLFRRTGTSDVCLNNPKEGICTKSVKELDTSLVTPVLKCGKSGEKLSTVKVSIIPCPENTAEKCLNVAYILPAGATNFVDVHLRLSNEKIDVSAPGKPGNTNFNSYCTNSQTSASCTVPISVIITRLYPGLTEQQLCGKTLYIGAHTSISDGNTCWGAGIDIVDKSNNWATQIPFVFQCKDICKERCCCPGPPTPPPPTDKYCSFGTAFGYNPAVSPCVTNKGNDPPCPWTLKELGCGRWGWYAEVTKSQLESSSGYTSDLYAGAGLNKLDNAKLVGQAVLKLVNGEIKVTYTMAGGYYLDEAHVYIGKQLPANLQDACAPGQYNVKSEGECLNGAPGWSGTYKPEDPNCAKYYVILHASVSTKKPAGTECKTCVKDTGASEPTK